MDEKKILLEMYKLVNMFLLQTYEIDVQLNQLHQDIDNLDNNYFMKNNLLHFFPTVPEQHFDNLNNLKNIIEHKLDNICIHEWIDDYIDDSSETSQHICYCKLCEVSKK